MALARESLEHRGQHFHGQRSAPHYPPLSQPAYQVGADVRMTCGMAHVSGASWPLHRVCVEAKHLLTAVIMTAPGTLLMPRCCARNRRAAHRWRVQMPENGKRSQFPGCHSRGTSDGLHLAINVGCNAHFLLRSSLCKLSLSGAHNVLAAHASGFPSSLQQVFGGFRAGGLAHRVSWHDASTSETCWDRAWS